MEIVDYIDLFVGSLINIMFYGIVIKKVFRVSMTKDLLVRYGAVILSSIILGIINIYNKDFFKILFTIPFITLAMKFIFNEKIEKSFLYVLIATFYMFIGEILTALIFSILPVDYIFIFNYILGRIMGSIIVTLLTYPFLYLKFASNFFQNIVSKFSSKETFIQGFIFLMIVSAITYKNTIGINNIIIPIMDVIIFAIFLIIVYLLYKKTIKISEISENYNILLTYTEKYEKEIEEKRKIVHDFKNQMIVINGYADPSNIKLKEYISEIISEQKNASSNLFVKNADKLPKGLKGLIYYKLTQIDDSIKKEITIKNNLDKFDKLSPKLNREVLKIVGILLDNAIESAMNSKEKCINIEFEIKENKFIMILQNSIKEKVDISKIMMPGFSTKGRNRGYGLSLVSDIINKNKEIEIKIDSKNEFFESKLKVNLKYKSHS